MKLDIPDEWIESKAKEEAQCESIAAGNPNGVKLNTPDELRDWHMTKKRPNGPPKQVIVMRKDLNMRKGKIAAQAAHASMGALLKNHMRSVCYPLIKNSSGEIIFIEMNNALREWLNNSFTKICVSCDSEDELLEIERKANDAEILNCLITDNGTTEFNGVPTRTCIALGPDYPNKIDVITGHLRLY